MHLRLACHCTFLCVQIPCDPKLVASSFEPQKLSKFFVTSIEQQPRRELLLPADVGIPIRLVACYCCLCDGDGGGLCACGVVPVRFLLAAAGGGCGGCGGAVCVWVCVLGHQVGCWLLRCL